MYYVWTPDWESPSVDEVSTPDGWDQLILFDGEKLDTTIPLPRFSISAEHATDALVNHLAYLVFNSKLRRVIEELTHDPVQYLPTSVICSTTGKQIKDYAICNPLVQIEGIDKGAEMGVNKIVLTKERVLEHSFFRIASFPYILIVREDIARGVIESGCTGVAFEPVEDFRV